MTMPGFVNLPELLVFTLVLVVLFGAKRIPELGRSLGRSVKEFRHGIAGGERRSDATADPRSRDAGG
jgi:sec-independent protein translocase protein TatA